MISQQIDLAMPGTEGVSQLIVRWQNGESGALTDLMPLVYTELRKLGRAHLRRRPDGVLLQPTELVHEAWIKLARNQSHDVTSRSHFYALAARIMRDFLVDHFRAQRAAKRGGSQIRVDLDKAQPHSPSAPDILVLDDSIRRLGAVKPRYAEIVELRFFGGLSIDETALALGVSSATIEREWNVARSWLKRDLSAKTDANPD
jgi:RNA polymerase sigma-70 factor (ECF subfamily)